MKKLRFNYKLLSDGLIIVGLLALASAFLLAAASVGDGSYESNIYAVYPPFFWVVIMVVLAIGFGQVFIIFIKFPKSYRWLLGLGLIAAVNIFIVTLPYFRDYYFSGQWDSANHNSLILNITDLGYAFPEDFYPVSHALVAAFSIISGKSVPESMNLTSSIFYVVGILNMFFLAWVFDPSPRVRGVLVVLSSIPLYFNYQTMFFPVQFSVYMLLFFIGWFLRTRSPDRNWKEVVVLIFTLLFLPYLHPLAVLVPLAYLFSYLLSLVRSKIDGIRSGTYDLGKVFESIIPSFFILFAGWFLWFSTFRAFGSTISHLYDVFRDGIVGRNSLESFISASERANLDMLEIFRLILSTYSPSAGLILVAFLGLIIFYMKKSEAKIHLREDFTSFPLLMFVFSVLAFASLFRDLITSNPLRYLNFGVVLAPLVVAPILNQFWKIESSKRSIIPKLYSTWFMPIFAFAVAGISIFNIYYSPLTGQPNNQYSYARAAGADFFLRHAADNPGGIYSISARERIFRGVRPIETILHLIIENPNWNVKTPPPHFGYDVEDTDQISSFEDPQYLFITGYGEAYYVEVWPSGGRFTPKDFEVLSDDPNWNCVYQSGDFTLWVWRNTE
jgi:hypothetical protein